MIKKLAILVLFTVLNSSVYATEPNNEWTNNILSHQIEITSPEEIRFKTLKGFIELLISKSQKRYLPLIDICEINQFTYGVYVEFNSKVMKNGRGTMATTIYIPAKVIHPKAVIDNLHTILADVNL